MMVFLFITNVISSVCNEHSDVLYKKIVVCFTVKI